MPVLAIIGSPSRFPSRSSALLDHVVARLVDEGIELAQIAVRDLPADDLIEVRGDGAAGLALRAAVARSDAIVVATPVYNASIPGGLKALLDLLPERALADKIVLPLASGGSVGHQLAIEYSMKPVLSALGARHVLSGVFASDGDVEWVGARNDEAALQPHLVARLEQATDALIALRVAAGRSTIPPLRLLRRERTSSFPERCRA